VPPQAKETFFRVRVEGKGIVAAELPGAYEAAETEDLGDVALSRGGPLAGRVQGPDGTPVPGASVTLTPRARPGDSPDLAPVSLAASTAPDGTFRFDAAGTGANDLLVEAAGFAAQRSTPRRGARWARRSGSPRPPPSPAS
jgi:hypothetical protein